MEELVVIVVVCPVPASSLRGVVDGCVAIVVVSHELTALLHMPGPLAFVAGPAQNLAVISSCMDLEAPPAHLRLALVWTLRSKRPRGLAHIFGCPVGGHTCRP